MIVFNGIEIPSGLRDARRPFFNRANGRAFEMKAADDVTELVLYDEISDWGISAKEFRKMLATVTTPTIVLKINSPGGNVFDGIAIHNDLADHAAEVHVEVTGLAASAASIVAMAGDKITVAKNAFLMIHNAWTVAVGDRRAFADVAATLGQIDDVLAKTYVERSGQKLSDIVTMMNDETWLNGDEAVAAGLADSTGEEVEPQALFDLSCFAKVPAALANMHANGVRGPQTIRDFERALRDADAPRETARALVAGGFAAAAQRDAGLEGAETLAAGIRRLTAMMKP
jgi:ATP-dependent Clp protease protease subunit